ncbi:MAG: DUF1574 domain-containing protein [Leptospira sp.]|nr:DUF1574 domain-containing protein [Leptospira sp.]
MKNKAFIYYPVIFLIFLFFIDKIFTLSFFKERFLQSGNVIYYKQRKILFKRLEEDFRKTKKNIAIAFGDSRAYSISEFAFSGRPSRKEKWSVYNFSAAQAVPAYSYFLFEKMVSAGIKPGIVFFVVSPEGFDDSKRFMFKPFLRLGADDEFVIKYWKEIPLDDRKEYLLDKLIAYRGVEMDFKLLLSRLSKNSMDQYNPAFNKEMLILNLYKGEQLAYTTLANDTERLNNDSIRMRNVYFSRFRIDDTQFNFIEKFLILAKANNVPVFLIWPKVFGGYRKIYEDLGLEEKWWKRMISLSGKYSAKTFNLNDISGCNLFYDASHQSATCYNEQLNMLLDEFEKTTR